MGRLRGPAMAAAGLLLALAACGAGDDSSHDGASAVKVKTFQFTPNRVSIQSGETVTWTNEDDIRHTVTAGIPGSASGLFDSPLDGRGASASFTFAENAIVPYFCNIHQGMRGEVRIS